LEVSTLHSKIIGKSAEFSLISNVPLKGLQSVGLKIAISI